VLLRTEMSRFLPMSLVLSLALSPLVLLSGCGQTGLLYLPEKPSDETVTELDVTEGGLSDEVGVGAEAGLDAGIEASREGGLSDGLEGTTAGPVEGSGEGGGIAVDDEVLIETDDAPGGDDSGPSAP